jgi:hypothetical protein
MFHAIVLATQHNMGNIVLGNEGCAAGCHSTAEAEPKGLKRLELLYTLSSVFSEICVDGIRYGVM